MGARCRLARPPRLGRHRLRGRWVFALGQLNRFLDTNVVDGTFDKGCEESQPAAACWRACKMAACKPTCSILAFAVVALAAILIWSSRP